MAALVDRATFLQKYLTVCNWPEHNCPMCMEPWSISHLPVTFTHSTSCKGHAYCRGCITTWLSQDGVNTCPECRCALFKTPKGEVWQDDSIIDIVEDANEDMLDDMRQIFYIRSAPELHPQQPIWQVTKPDIESIVQALWIKYWNLTAEYRAKYSSSWRDDAEESRWTTYGPDPRNSREVFITAADMPIDWSLLSPAHWRIVNRMAKRMTNVIRQMYMEDSGVPPEEQFETDPFEKMAEVSWRSVERLGQVFEELDAWTGEDGQGVDYDDDAVTGTCEVEDARNNNAVVDLTGFDDEA